MKLPRLTPEQRKRAMAAYARLQAWIPTYVLLGDLPGHMCDVPNGIRRESAITANAAIFRMIRGELK